MNYEAKNKILLYEHLQNLKKKKKKKKTFFVWIFFFLPKTKKKNLNTYYI